jgi:hypothetical protein
LTHCVDLRNEALAFDILVTAALFLLLRPKAIIIFWSLVCIGFWHVNLFSDPAVPPDLSTAFGTFLPSLFICYAFWRAAFRHTFPAFSEIPIERLIWYLPAYWAGVLFTQVTAGIPIDRLVGSDLSQRPGAILALIICIVVIAALVINQIRVVRKTGWVLYYLKWYSLAALALLVLACLPGLQFRLHHYFAAILIIPITAFPTRLSAIYQAFALGMFLNGASKFGLASILQTAAEVSFFYYLLVVILIDTCAATSRCTIRYRSTCLLNKLCDMERLHTVGQSSIKVERLASKRIMEWICLACGRCGKICRKCHQLYIGRIIYQHSAFLPPCCESPHCLSEVCKF